mgnify:CR=1 FL=1
MEELTLKVKLLAFSRDIDQYTTYVFENLESTSPDDKYLMCVKFPNWNQSEIALHDIGYLNVRYVREGISKWYDGEKMNTYKYTNVIFLKFIKEPEKLPIPDITTFSDTELEERENKLPELDKAILHLNGKQQEIPKDDKRLVRLLNFCTNAFDGGMSMWTVSTDYNDHEKEIENGKKQLQQGQNQYEQGLKSYENKMLQRQIRSINFDLTTTKEIIASEEQNLREYLKNKEI